MSGREEAVLYGRYISAGGPSAIVFVVISFTLSEALDVWYQTAYTAAFVVSTSVRFVLMRWAFRDSEKKGMWLKFALLFAVTYILFRLNFATLGHLVENLHWHKIGTQILLMIVPWSPFYYLANRKIFLGYYFRK